MTNNAYSLDFDLQIFLDTPGAMAELAQDNQITVEELTAIFEDAIANGIEKLSELNDYLNKKESQMINETEYKTNGQGHKVPVDKIKPLDLLRDEVVLDLVNGMKELKRQTIDKKAAMMKKFNDFVELSFNEYGVKCGGRKGNITLTSFDGNYQVCKAIGEYKHFDERIQAAKALLDECVVEWSSGANENLKALVDHAFRVNKQGKIDVNQVLGLRQLDIEEPKWLQAMDAIADSIQVTGSAEYIRFYQRDTKGKYQQVNIDFSRV